MDFRLPIWGLFKLRESSAGTKIKDRRPKTTIAPFENRAFQHIIPTSRYPFFSREPHIVSIFTLYRPNFCSACGAKIVRLRWHFWTSRKFCDTCVGQFRKEQWLQPALLVSVLVLLGILIGRSMRQSPPPLLIQRNVVASSPTGSPQPPQTISAEEIYLCGARTKKGTPCSRRVHGAVRCWQHKGMSAMLPPDRLRIKD